MFLLKCLDCGHVFERGEEKACVEHQGECHGVKAYEETSCCPLCGGVYEEASRCKICDMPFCESELDCGVCEECKRDIGREYKYDVKKCYDLAEFSGEKQAIEINSFLACMFTPEEINKILYREIVCASAFSAVDCSAFILCDEDWFVEKALEIKKEVK